MLPSYSAVTPVRDESENLGRLAACMSAQTALPDRWLIVDNGSQDDTPAVIERILADLVFARSLVVPNVAPRSIRGRPIVAAFESGVAALDSASDVVVKLDADVSFERDYFARLMEAFADNDRLGIASGTCYEQDRGGVWRAKHRPATTCAGRLVPTAGRLSSSCSRSSSAWVGTGSTS